MSLAADEALHIRLNLPRAGFRLDVDLQLPGRGISVLFGASGSGKTTVLRCVAGLERALQGRVQIGGELWQDEATRHFLPTWRRPLGYVFQEASLFEHLSVQQNLRYGLRRSGQNSASDALDAPVSLLGIGHLLGRMPAGLSGGERQRVAIARALANKPPIILADEPTAPLDSERALTVVKILNRLAQEFHTAIIVVTHDEKIIPTFKRIYHIRDGKTYEEAGEGRPL
jgi:molybdate transport system ATP-binding protein